jgi:MFS family permease
MIGTLATILASIGFGLLVYVKDDMTFFVLSLALRFVQGFGDAASSTSVFSIIGSEYADK